MQKPEFAVDAAPAELVKPTAAVRRADAFVALLCLSDWQRGGTFDAAKFDDDLALFVSSLRGAVEQLPFVALVLCPARPSAQQTKFSAAAMTLRALELPRLRVLDARELAGAYAVCEMHDVVADELGHVPYTDEMWCALGAICSRGVLPALAPPLKVVVVDCDYTLWHGAVGELGAAGVSVEPRHAQLQARLIELRERGVLIALCSRNEEADVWAAFERASGMLLSREHVSTFRIAPTLAKGAAVRALCVELRCAAEHVLFVDDNPAEVAAVRAALPAAACWVFPQTHAEAKAQLPHVWRLEVPHAAPSAEDGARRALAAARAGAASLRRAAPSRAEYHAALGVRIDVSSLADADAPARERLLQLHERTNQFNTWKWRPPPPAALAAAEGVAIRVADRFADYGLVGNASARAATAACSTPSRFACRAACSAAASSTPSSARSATSRPTPRRRRWRSGVRGAAECAGASLPASGRPRRRGARGGGRRAVRARRRL